MTPAETVILKKQIVVGKLQAKLDKKRAANLTDVTLDEEVLYSERLALSKLLEV